MSKIINKKSLAPGIRKIEVQSALIAQKTKAGQFVIVIPEEKSERIPLTLSDWNTKEETITLIFQEIGSTTKKLGRLEIGDNIYSMLGPLGKPTQIKNFGTVVCIGGGIGIAEIYPVSRALKNEKNEIIGIIGTRTKDLIILENEMKQTCDQLYITTDDGSYEKKGFVTEVLNEILTAKKHIDLVYAIGPLAMMHSVAKTTKPFNIKTIVSLNPIMVDGTGMCGSCRVSISGESYFACVDGPDFDAHQVDFDELQTRLGLFKTQEECSNKVCPNRTQNQ